MDLPFFYTTEPIASKESAILDEANSRHAIQVLRLRDGDQIVLADGRGNLSNGVISASDKKRCTVTKLVTNHCQKRLPETVIAMSLLKNVNRFEWFLEKATEFGMTKLQPLVCYRTEKTAFRRERLNQILVSAMLQSQQAWLPELADPVKFDDFVLATNIGNRFIAHCAPGEKDKFSDALQNGNGPRLILIGPEGDFSVDEIRNARAHLFTPVSLGNTRLRSETAGVAAACLMALQTAGE
ncbi:MAG TPA: RsmE family RNA methyltransferase [Puia sp.]|nr:RsmE family RNA methyltransferase [Puia sp.]